MSKPPTAKQRRRWARVVAIGCLVCGGPASIHHCRHACGLGQRNHDHVAPLCGEHHQYGAISRHGKGGKEFVELYGSDLSLHIETCLRLGETNHKGAETE